MWSLFRTVSFIFLYRKKSVFKDWGLRSKHTQIKVCTGLKNTLLLCAAFKMLKDFKNLKPGLVILCKFDSMTMQAESDNFLFFIFQLGFSWVSLSFLGKILLLTLHRQSYKIHLFSVWLFVIHLFFCLSASFFLSNEH